MEICSRFALFVQQKQIQYCKADFIFVEYFIKNIVKKN